MVGLSVVLLRIVPIMKCVWAIPCSVANCCIPRPPRLLGACTTARGMWRLNPSLGSSVWVSGCCILSSVNHGIVDAPSPYLIVGRSTVVYPIIVSYASSGACAKSFAILWHFSFSRVSWAFVLPSSAIGVPSSLYDSLGLISSISHVSFVSLSMILIEPIWVVSFNVVVPMVFVCQS